MVEQEGSTAPETAQVYIHPLILACGLLVTIMGVLVLIGWFTHQPTLIQVLPTFVPMQFNTALGFLLCGAALLLLAAGRRQTGATAAAIAGLIGLLTLIEYSAGIGLHIDQLFMEHYITVQTSHPGRMAPNTALCFLLSATAMLLLNGKKPGNRRTFFCGVLSTVVIALGLTAFGGYISGLHTAYGWGKMTRMAVHTSAGFVVLGTGLLSLSWIRVHRDRRRFINWLPVSFALLFLTASVIIWQAQEARDHERLHELTRTTARGLAEAVEIRVQDLANALKRMSHRWELREALQEPYWRADARAHLGDFPGLVAMEWVDPDFVVRWVEPEADNDMVLGLNLSDNTHRRPILEMAREENIPVVTPVVDILQGGRGFDVIVPITVRHEPGGFMLGVVDLDNFIPTIVKTQQDQFVFRILENNRLILEEGDWSATRGIPVEESVIHLPGDRKWTIAVTPGRALTDASQLIRDVLMLGAGLLMALLAALAVRFAQTSRERTRELLLHKQHLEDLVELRTISLKESERRFRSLYENVPISLWDEDWTAVIAIIRGLNLPTDTDFHGYFTSHMDLVRECLQHVVINDVNSETLEMFGAKSKDKMLQSLETVFNTPDTLPGFIGELAALAACKTVYETEMLLNKVNGDRFTVLLKMSFPRPGADHGQVLVSLTDISELKQIQAIAERERTITDSVLDALPGVFYQIRTDGTFARWNSRFEKATGYDADDLKQMKATELFRGEDIENIAAAMQRVFVEGEAVVEADFVHRDGTATPYLFNGKLFEIEGEPFLIGMGLDVGNLKEIETELRTLNEKLETSNRELEQFAYVASHDLQEPLRMVSSYTQLLEKRYKDKLDDDAKDFIHFAVDGANRMQRLIQDLLTYSRITTRGKEPNPVSVQSVMGHVLVNLSETINEHQAIITNDNLPVVMGDFSQLVMLFQNLISNGIKFHGEETPRIHISVQEDGETVTFAVRDNGIGMDLQYAEQIFVIFKRLHTRSEFPGTGIGLAVCKRIVERLGGTIWVESEPGVGSTFCFTLPLAKEQGGSNE